ERPQSHSHWLVFRILVNANSRVSIKDNGLALCSRKIACLKVSLVHYPHIASLLHNRYVLCISHFKGISQQLSTSVALFDSFISFDDTDVYTIPPQNNGVLSKLDNSATYYDIGERRVNGIHRVEPEHFYASVGTRSLDVHDSLGIPSAHSSFYSDVSCKASRGT
ncbi:hypothetical protein CPB85DRAFT_1567064, partial [Mucidula mucida]